MKEEQTKPRLRSRGYQVTLEGCHDHPEGCYLRVSEEGPMIVADFNTEGALVGIEIVDGLKWLITSLVSSDKGNGE